LTHGAFKNDHCINAKRLPAPVLRILPRLARRRSRADELSGAEPKVPPLHPGAVIADILDDQRVSLRTCAAAIGMSPTGLSKVLTGKSPVTPDTALRIALYFNNEAGAALWLNLQQASDLWHARARLAGELKAIKPLPGGVKAA
jgi:addiction module HigA family antidote